MKLAEKATTKNLNQLKKSLPTLLQVYENKVNYTLSEQRFVTNLLRKYFQMPTYPKSAFFLFLEQRGKQSNSENRKDWLSLTEDAKQEYHAKFLLNKNKYYKQIDDLINKLKI